MSTETEHKYLVISNEYEKMTNNSYRITQGYLSREPERTVRVRLIDDKAYLTIKGKTVDDTRAEYEYEIPFDDAQALIGLCEGRIIDKIRYIVPYGGYIWEVDKFLGDLSSLIVAEIELKESTHNYPLPPFVGEEVTDNPQYYNSNL